MTEIPKKIRMDKKGLEAFFGELEAKIMERLWSQDDCSILCVQKGLRKERDYSYNTIMTVLNRLVEKGWVNKKKTGKTTYYLPVQRKEQFMKTAAKAVLSTFFGKKAVFSIAQFAEALDDISEKDMEELRKHLDQ